MISFSISQMGSEISRVRTHKRGSRRHQDMTVLCMPSAPLVSSEEAVAMADFFWFSVERWARIEQLLPQDTRGMPRVDDRRVLSGIVPALKSSGRWGDRGV